MQEFALDRPDGQVSLGWSDAPRELNVRAEDFRRPGPREIRVKITLELSPKKLEELGAPHVFYAHRKPTFTLGVRLTADRDLMLRCWQ